MNQALVKFSGWKDSAYVLLHIQGSTETPSEIVAQTYYDWPRKISDAFMDCCRNRLQISTKDSNTTSNKIQWAYLITMWTDTGEVSPRKKEEIRRTLEITTKFQNLRFSLGVTASEALAYRNCCIIQDRLNRLRIAEVLISWLENLSSTPNAFPDARAWSSIRKTNSLSLSLLVQRWKNRRKIESDFILAMARIAFHKLRFMSCSSGLIGLAPENAMAGDQICLLRGCTKPLILRRVVPPTMPNQDSASAWEKRYEIIGEPFLELNQADEAIAARILGDQPAGTRTRLEGERFFDLV